MECSICCERFNKSNHSKVKCGFCNFPQCTSCAERYILDSSDDPHCMNCKTGWDTAKLVENFTQKFVTKDLKTRRETLLFERERALMPATQAAAERVVKSRKAQQEITRLNTNIHDLSLSMQSIHVENGDNIKWYQDTMPIRYEIAKLEADARYQAFLVQEYNNGPRRVDPIKRFIRCCPATDCKGFLSTGWKCGLCGIKACANCHEIKNEDEDHVCLKENVESARLIEKDSRPCPKCAAMIFKIDGCDQMWCTQCQTTFSFRTGQVETGRTHNPHYYEYLRRQNNGVIPREPGDIVRGGGCEANMYPDPYAMTRALNNLGTNTTIITNTLRSLLHNHYVIRDWQPDAYTQHTNQKIRIDYMINDITEDQYKKELQKREKARNKKRDMHDILGMFENVSRDIMHKIMRETEVRNIDDHMRELHALRDYVNEHMHIVSKRYGCVYPRLCEDWIMRSSKV